jgi:hypothetical protein
MTANVATTIPLKESPPSLYPLGVTGDALRHLREMPQKRSPLPGVLDVEPSLHVLSALPKRGKTTFGLHLASAWAQGLAPWSGTPNLQGTRAVYISAEQTVQRLERMLRRITKSSRLGSVEGWTERVSLIGRASADLPGVVQEVISALQRLDRKNLQLLRAALEEHDRQGDPVGLLVLDSLSRLKPPEISENDADEMTEWLGQLQALAADLGVYVLLIHHTGHANRAGAVSAPRGSSAISAVAQVVMKLDIPSSNPRQRRLQIEGNEIEQDLLTFNVCDPDDAEGRINYFRPDRSLEDEINEAMPIGEAFSIKKLSEQIHQLRTGEDLKAADKAVSGTLRKKVTEVLERSIEAGFVERVGTGPRSQFRRLKDLSPAFACEF